MDTPCAELAKPLASSMRVAEADALHSQQIFPAYLCRTDDARSPPTGGSIA